ncbi:DUF7287 family protein [Candidatus Methanoperedens nitratireducens]|uniref:Uncharacterized protein n=1 Tax=Candidatus Methanoperedens nitratireducens TaxID=1392998 RepID=A0A284VQT9_9EURY|nr:hypothetical protein [Candidatus Methanoperedens nitroreducens]SNQ61656.1 conserved hypothetical protein [Candidatus Methanoperedens nitroreducens]
MNIKSLQSVDGLHGIYLLASLNIIKDKIKDVKGEGAQITIDYVAGMSIFLLTVAFVFQFMYGLFIPFQSGSEEVTLAADRVSTILVERMLVADRAGAMSVIDQGKLIYFNNTKLNVSNQTSYTNTLRELGLFSKESVFDLNVSVANITYPNNPMNQSGPELPDNLDIGQTRRFVLIVNASTGYNETAIISVRVW